MLLEASSFKCAFISFLGLLTKVPMMSALGTSQVTGQRNLAIEQLLLFMVHSGRYS